MEKLRVLPDQLCLPGRTEHLREIKRLSFIHDVDDLVRMEQLHSFDNGSQIRRIVERCPIRLQDHAGRNLLGIAFLFHIDDQRSLVVMGNAAFLQVLHHIGYVRLGIRFRFPQVKRDVQLLVVLFQVRDRHFHNLVPQCPVAALSQLQLMRRLHGFRLVFLVLFGFCGSSRIDFLQLRNGKRSLFRIFPFKVIPEISQVRPAFFQLGDDQSHLETPVAQMHISQDFMPYGTSHPLQALPDDCRTQMSDMKGLGNIRSAVIDDDLQRFLRLRNRKIRIIRFRQDAVAQESLRDINVQKSGHHGFAAPDDGMIRQCRGC